MGYGNTIGDGTGTFYHNHCNTDGALLVSPDWVGSFNQNVDENDSDKEFQLADTHKYKLQSMYVAYTASGDAGNRKVAIIISDGNPTKMMEIRCPAAIAAGETRYIYFGIGLDRMSSFEDTNYITCNLPDIILPPSYFIRVLDVNATAVGADDMLIYWNLLQSGI